MNAAELLAATEYEWAKDLPDGRVLAAHRLLGGRGRLIVGFAYPDGWADDEFW